MRPIVNVLRLGRIAYADALQLQQQLRDKLLGALQERRNVENYLLLVEHDPVYTVGLRAQQYDAALERRLRELGADFRRTERGGKITFHGHGQLTVYPIVYLGSFRTQKSVKRYVHLLEEAIVLAGQSILGRERPQLQVSTLAEHPGVWIDQQRKLAAIGVHCRRYVTMHGLALNCDVDLGWFEQIVPCDIVDKSVTSLSAELGRQVTVDQAIPPFLQAFRQAFQCELIDVCG